MKKRICQTLIIGLLLAATMFSAFGMGLTVRAETPEGPAAEPSADKDFYYLSEIPYDKQKSYTRYDRIRADSSSSGDGIRLKIDGLTVAFSRGVGAHAESCVIYDISQYSDVQSRFYAYVGVDARQGGNGDGVKITVSVSDDGSSWETLKQTDTLKGDSNAVLVDVMVTGKKYLKLYADPLTYNGSDHTVYADARLMKPTYDPSVEDQVPFKTLAAYDQILAANTIEDNLANHVHTIYEREFVSRVGYHNLKLIYKHEEYVEAIEFLRKDPTALAYFIEGGRLARMNGTNPYNTLEAFAKIYNAHKEMMTDPAENHFYLRLAISTACAFNYPANLRFWTEPSKPNDPVSRFDTYVEFSKPGGYMDIAGEGNGHNKWSGQEFRNLPVPMMRWVVDARMNDDEFKWLADFALEKKKAGRNFLDAYEYIEYDHSLSMNYADPQYYAPENREKWNSIYNFEPYFSDYGDLNVRRLWIVFAEGAVCGGLAKTYANLAEVFGRPSIVVGQPGHAATMTWQYAPDQNRYIWKIQNDVSGWTKSNSEYGDFMLGWGTSAHAAPHSFRATYTLLAVDAIADYENYTKAAQCVLLANSYQSAADKETLYRKALEYQSIHLDAWDGLTTLRLQNDGLTDKDLLNFAQEIMNGLTYYPRPMDDLLRAIKPKIKDQALIAQFDLLRVEALKKAEAATDKEIPQPEPCRIIAKDLLSTDTTYLASFSFDGDKPGTIVIDDSYQESDIRVRYSLDGGATWETTSEHDIVLTPEQLASLTAENDIQVGLVGVSYIYTIDLVDSKTPSQNGVWLNDYENLFVGATQNLEFCTTDSGNWCSYVPGLDSPTRFPGDMTVQLRYKYHDRTIGSPIETFTFHQNADTPDKTYLQLQNVKFVSCSSQNSKQEAGTNLIDGNINTRWHSHYNKVDEKEYIVEFPQPRHISALEYFPHAANGRWKDVEIFVSMDKEEWTLVGKESLANNEDMKTIPLDSTHEARYLKVKGLNSWGNPADKFFSGRMLNFYEDLTKNILPPAEITYSISDKTNQDVVASITLPEGCQMTEGDTTHTFTENGKHTFKYTDAHNNAYEVTAEVTWIRKAVLTGKVTYSETAPTNNNVVATVGGFEFDDVYVANNDRSVSHTFTQNGTFDFELADEYGNTGIVTASVANIDLDAPKVHVTYSGTDWTSDDIVATVVADDESERFTVVNNGGEASHTFQKNGSFTFEVRDAAGNEAKVIATVAWIDKAKDQIRTDFSTLEQTSDPVTATVTVDPDAHQIVSNDGSATHTFTQNGTYVFKIRLLDSGLVVDYPVTVSNIVPPVKPDPQPEPEIPEVTEPEVPEVTEPEVPEVTEPEVPEESKPDVPYNPDIEDPHAVQPGAPADPEDEVPAAPAPNVTPHRPESGSAAEKPGTNKSDSTKPTKPQTKPDAATESTAPAQTDPSKPSEQTQPVQTPGNSDHTDETSSFTLVIVVALIAAVVVSAAAVFVFLKKRR